MSRSIALTGATGFIGGAVAQRLQIAGWQIRVLVRSTSPVERLAGVAAQLVKGDLEDPESLRRLVHGAYAVVHCAGVVRGASLADFSPVNIDGVVRVVHAAREQHPVPRFLLISSLAAREPAVSPYAASKRRGEEVLVKMAGEMSWSAFRPPAVYGPGDRELLPLFRLISRGIAPVPSSKNARFSLLYADDLAEAVVSWLDSGSRERRSFELHDGEPNGYAWEDVIDCLSRLYARRVIRIQVPVAILKAAAALNVRVAKVAGYAPMLTPGKIGELRHQNWVCDNSDLNRETGWAPHVSLEEGLRRTLRVENGIRHRAQGTRQR